MRKRPDIALIALVVAVLLGAGAAACLWFHNADRYRVDEHGRILPKDLGRNVLRIEETHGGCFKCRGGTMTGRRMLMEYLWALDVSRLGDGILLVCYSKVYDKADDPVTAVRAFAAFNDVDLFVKVPISEGTITDPQPGDYARWVVKSTRTRYRTDAAR